jgi:hypothetical protein
VQEIAPFAGGVHRFATVTEGASGRAAGDLGGNMSGDEPDCLDGGRRRQAMPSSSGEQGESRRVESGRLTPVAMMQAAENGGAEDGAMVAIDHPRMPCSPHSNRNGDKADEIAESRSPT